MSDNEYTPSTEDVENGYAHDPEVEYRDPVNYGYAVAGNRRAFRRWLAALDAAIRKDQAERDIAIVNQLYPLGSEVLGNAPTVIAVALRSQSFTGTESEQNG